MKKILCLAIILSLFCADLFSQQIVNRDPEIEAMVKEISSDSLKSYIQTLVSFGTRSTIGSTTDKKKGIGAARQWVVQRFTEFGRNSNGRMSAYVDTITLQPDGRRVDKAISLGNAVAVLKGTDPNDDRVYIISGHLDRRVTDVMNRTSHAPGANDDGSGVAAVMECARVMSKHSFPATIIFVAVSGEEQGLLGSNFLAATAKSKSANSLPARC